jgi:hypothetical protein
MEATHIVSIAANQFMKQGLLILDDFILAISGLLPEHIDDHNSRLNCSFHSQEQVDQRALKRDDDPVLAVLRHVLFSLCG